MTAPLGIFARTFRRRRPREVAAAVRAAGYDLVQLNLNSFGAPTIPTAAEQIDIDVEAVAAAFAAEQIDIWGVSMTYNLIHPDPARRAALTEQAAHFAAAVPALGAGFATLCTGTRDPDDMWRAHPENDSPAAWSDLRGGLDVLLDAARRAGIRLGVEPEPANVIRDASAARRLLDELGDDAALIGIVLDPANLLSGQDVANPARQADILTEAAQLLGEHIVCVHAKDFTPDGTVAAGTGSVDYDLVARMWDGLSDTVPVVVQDVTEDEAAPTRARLADILARHTTAPDAG